MPSTAIRTTRDHLGFPGIESFHLSPSIVFGALLPTLDGPTLDATKAACHALTLRGGLGGQLKRHVFALFENSQIFSFAPILAFPKLFELYIW